jgi:putative permease
VWGVFFSIPFATLVKAIYNSWPRHDEPEASLADAAVAAE